MVNLQVKPSVLFLLAFSIAHIGYASQCGHFGNYLCSGALTENYCLDSSQLALDGSCPIGALSSCWSAGDSDTCVNLSYEDDQVHGYNCVWDNDTSTCSANFSNLLHILSV